MTIGAWFIILKEPHCIRLATEKEGVGAILVLKKVADLGPDFQIQSKQALPPWGLLVLDGTTDDHVDQAQAQGFHLKTRVLLVGHL